MPRAGRAGVLVARAAGSEHDARGNPSRLGTIRVGRGTWQIGSRRTRRLPLQMCPLRQLLALVSTRLRESHVGSPQGRPFQVRAAWRRVRPSPCRDFGRAAFPAAAAWLWPCRAGGLDLSAVRRGSGAFGLSRFRQGLVSGDFSIAVT